MARCGCTSGSECVCNVGISDCISMSGTGSAGDPFVPVLVLSEDAGNIAECRDDGLWAGTRFDHDTKASTSGNITINGTAWANLDTTLDITLTEVAVGHIVGVWAMGYWAAEAVEGRLDVVSVVAGSPVNSWGHRGAIEAAGGGIMAWAGRGSVFSPIAGGTEKALVAGDIENGSVLLRLRRRTGTAANKSFSASTAEEFHWGARNYGPVI